MSAVRIITTPGGRRFAYIGDYTLRALDEFGGFWEVTRDIDSDEVRVASGLTLNEATAVARENA